MRFLLLNQFYPPDAAPTGQYLHGLARVLAERGHEVKVLCSRRSYDGTDSYPRRETLDGVSIVRLPAAGFGRRGFIGKLADYGSYYLSLALSLLFERHRPDLILSLTTPPYVGLLGKFAAGWHRCRHAHWIMDVYPDVLFAHGLTHRKGLLSRFLRGLTRFELRGASDIITLGPCMAERVAPYLASPSNSAIHNSPTPQVSGLIPQPSSKHLRFQVSSLSPASASFPPSPLHSSPTLLRAGETFAAGAAVKGVREDASPEGRASGSEGVSVSEGRVAVPPTEPGEVSPGTSPSPIAAPSPEAPAFGNSGFRFHPSALHSCPLWSDPSLAPWPDGVPNQLRRERGWGEDELVLLYSGNMGLGHRFGEFLEAARRFGLSGPRWVFSGGGKRRAEIEAFARANPSARIEFLGYVPHARLREHLCAADVHLASMDAAWQGLIVPSKLQGSFAVGRPVIHVGARGGETAGWIQQSGGGWFVEEDDVDGLLVAIQQAGDSAERHRRGQAAAAFARAHFEMKAICTQLANILEGSPKG